MQAKNLPASKSADDVLAERLRQIEVEGFTQDRDLVLNGTHDLAIGGFGYLHHYLMHSWMVFEEITHGLSNYQKELVPRTWPLHWDEAMWKPKNPRADLVRAAALIIAEIDRLDATMEAYNE